MPSLLKASDLASAHIIRGRLDAEGHPTDVVHENASTLWGGAVAGGPVLVTPPAAFPEIGECVAAVEEVEPPPEADQGTLPLPPASPGIAGSALIGLCMVAIAVTGEFVVGNLANVLEALTGYLPYDGGPIPLHLPDPQLSITALGFGALAGAGVHLLKRALRDPAARIIIAALVFILFSHLPGLIIAAIIVLLDWAIRSFLGGIRRQTNYAKR